MIVFKANQMPYRNNQSFSDLNDLGGNTMKLSKPKVITWWIAVILGVVGILSTILPIPALAAYAFWLLAVGFVLLVLGTALKGL